MPQDEQICGTYAEHHNRMPVQSIKDLTPSGPREKLTHAQRVDVAKTPVIEITRTRMMECMITSPVIIRRQGRRIVVPHARSHRQHPKSLPHHVRRSLAAAARLHRTCPQREAIRLLDRPACANAFAGCTRRRREAPAACEVKRSHPAMISEAPARTARQLRPSFGRRGR